MLIILAPLFAAFVAGILGMYRPRLVFPTALCALAVSLISALLVVVNVPLNGSLRYSLGGWPAPLGIEFVIDRLNALVLIIVAFVALLNLISSLKHISQFGAQKAANFYAVYLLFVVGLLGMTITGDVFNLYCFN